MSAALRPHARRLLFVLFLSHAAPLFAAAEPSRAGPARKEAYYHYSMAQQMIMERDYLHALEQMENAIATDSSPALLLELAQLKFSLNDLNGAADLADRAVASDPGLAEAHKLLGDIHLNRARDGGGDAETQIEQAIGQYRAALQSDPGDDDSCRALAELYYHTGHLQEAGETLQTFSRRKPLDPSMSLLLGKVDARSGRTAEAETILSRVVARLPGNVEAADALGAVLEFEKKYEEAVTVYRLLLEGGTDSAYVRNRIGTLHLLAGRYQDAIGDFQRARDIDPADPRSLLSLAQAYEGADDSAAAVRSYDSLIEKEPGNLEARFRRALLWHKEGDTAAALKAYRDIIDLANGRGAVTDREASILALTYSQIGLLQMDAHQFTAAAESFTQSLNTAGEPAPELFLLLGRAQLEGGNPDEARRTLAEAASRFPDDLDLKVFRGEILISQGDDTAARAYFRSVVTNAGGSAKAYAQVSEALLRQKRYASADAILKDGLRLHPEDDGLLFARGAAIERLGRATEAERLLAKAIQVNPKNAMALNYLGYMLADRGVKLEEAMAYIQRALALDPKNAAYLDSLGWAQFRLSRVDEAEKNLRTALEYEADDPSILEHLGDLLMQTGRKEEAVGTWQKALQHGHEQPERVRNKILKAQPVGRGAP